MRPYVGTILAEDYEFIRPGIKAVKDATIWFRTHGAHIDIQHEQRYWEYGSAVQAMMSLPAKLNRMEVLDVGSGHGALGPTLALTWGHQVTECEPDPGALQSRVECNRILAQVGRDPITVIQQGIDNLPEREFDAVCCMSVLEHIAGDTQEHWVELAKRVKKGGLLFVTVDCLQYENKVYHNDNLRNQKFTPEFMKTKVDWLMNQGFTPLGGEPDYRWNGAYVFDYTFMRIGMERIVNGDAGV